MPDDRPTIAAVLADARRRLRGAGIEDADVSARRLVAATVGIAEQRLGFATEAVDDAARTTLDARIARRIAGEPTGRILGTRGFWRHDFGLGPDVLEPRPDTEAVVEAALAALPSSRQRPRIADVGTGSGAILVSLLAERPDALGLGIDIAPGAVAVARRNAETAGVADRALFAVGDFASALAPDFDLVVSNPPYIPTADLAGLPAEVRLHDPCRALDGGPDGLDPYRALCAEARRVLAPGGRLVLEIGAGAQAAVTAVAGAAGLGLAEARSDLGGHVRALVFG
jgi:release factor glutamine methyltransferase